MKRTWTAVEVLNWAADDFRQRGIESPRLEAELLLAHVLGCRRIDLYTGFDRPLVDEELGRYREVISRRRNREPTSYILGHKEFWSLDLEVAPGVLIPRPDTETLVEAALGRIERGLALDLCTGTGCIAIALATERADLVVDAVDISEIACELARRNAAKHHVEDRVTVYSGDLFAPLPKDRRYALIATNPPYVIDAEIDTLSAEVRNEPRLALAGGADGLDLIRRILAEAPEHLDDGGHLLIELDPQQAGVVASELGPTALGCAGTILPDLAGDARVVAFARPRR